MTDHGNPIAEQLAARGAGESSQRAPESTTEDPSRNGTTETTDELTPEQEQAVQQAENPDAVRELISRISREKRAADAELKRLRDQAREAEDAEKSELQRLSEKNTALEAELAQLRLASLRSEIGAKYKLTPQMAQRLRGNTEAEIDADAKALADELGTETLPDLGQGARPPAPARGDMAFNDQIRRAAGRAVR